MSAAPLAPPRQSMLPTERTRADRLADLRATLVPSRNDLVDLGFTVLLVGLALWGFRTVFFGWEWILAAVGGDAARPDRGIPAPGWAAGGP
jgi:hypothetical protein